MFKVLGIALVVLALVTAILPQFTDCQSQGKQITLANGSKIPMKCHWTARAELATSIPLIGVGAMLSFSRRRESWRNLSIAGVILGAFVIALPTTLIGVCASGMPCHTVMQPVSVAVGSLAVVTSLTGIVLAQRRKEQDL